MLHVIYEDSYLNWQLGEDHPTNPIRATNTLRLLDAMRVPHQITGARYPERAELLAVHDEDYIDAVLREGRSDEWEGQNVELGTTASLMAGGTMKAVDMLLAREGKRFFNPQGAKHHAHRDHSSGFCVFNDMAMAAHRLNEAGLRVLYIDWDVHHGDGVEALCAAMPDTMTASIHGNGFPWTGQGESDSPTALNYCLTSAAGDRDWLRAISNALAYGADFNPDIVLLATGADSHRSDPLGALRVTVDGYAQAAQMVGDFANEHCRGRIIAGGAGGYQPHDWTPLCWATVARVLAEGA